MNSMTEAEKVQYLGQVTTRAMEQFRDKNKGKRVHLKGLSTEFEFEGCYLTRDGSIMILYRDTQYHSSHQSKLESIERIGD